MSWFTWLFNLWPNISYSNLIVYYSFALLQSITAIIKASKDRQQVPVNYAIETSKVYNEVSVNASDSWLIDRLIDWLIDWLTYRLIYWLTDYLCTMIFVCEWLSACLPVCIYGWINELIVKRCGTMISLSCIVMWFDVISVCPCISV